MEFRYSEKKISFEDFFAFLQAVEQDFVPPLLDRIDINAYYKKVNEYATMGECYCQDELVGLIISYDNDIESCKGYTTFCAVRGDFRGNNIAGMLLERACSHAKAQARYACYGVTYIQRNSKEVLYEKWICCKRICFC